MAVDRDRDDCTAPFVGAALVVQTSQMAAAGAVLGAVRSGLPPRQLRWRSAGVAIGLAVVAIVTQNLIA
jgi:hypothetical protein